MPMRHEIKKKEANLLMFAQRPGSLKRQVKKKRKCRASSLLSSFFQVVWCQWMELQILISDCFA